MGRTYAGILGMVAFAANLFHGLLQGRSTESTMTIASGCLFAFAAVGFVAGQLGSWFVTESVRAKINAELAAQETRTPAGAAR